MPISLPEPLARTWKYRYERPGRYPVRLTALQRKLIDLIESSGKMLDILDSRYRNAHKMLDIAATAVQKKQLVDSGAYSVSSREAELLEYSASIFDDAPEFFEQVVYEIEVSSYVAQHLRRVEHDMFLRLKAEQAVLSREWDECREARKGWFFIVLKTFGMAS